MDLSAVVITGGVTSAWVKPPGSGDLIRLRLGDDLEGWSVKEIQPDRLVLERQGERDELPLRDFAAAPPAMPPTPPPRARDPTPSARRRVPHRPDAPRGHRMTHASRDLPNCRPMRDPRPPALVTDRGWPGWRALALCLPLLLVAPGCERSYWDPTVKVGDPQGHLVDRGREQRGASTQGLTEPDSIALAGGDDVPKPVDSVTRGTGTFVRRVTGPTVDTAPGDVTLNFDGTDIREVVKVILGDLLQLNYVLHPAVQGVASLETGRPLRRDHLIPTLETLLRMNNAAVVYRNGTYEVVPLANAVQGKLVPQLGESTRALPEGYSVQVIPLQYIGAEEMNNILQPLAPEGSVIRVDTLRNLIVVAGTSPEMGNLLDTIRVFDVDWMTGLSVGFFVLEYAKANEVATQLEGLLADDSGNPFKGLFRFIPVESANSLLVITPQEKYIQQARNWIERLDLAEASGSAAERLFVYRVKHGSAENLADVLSELFGGAGGRERRGPLGGVAPGLGSSSIGSRAFQAIDNDAPDADDPVAMAAAWAAIAPLDAGRAARARWSSAPRSASSPTR